MNTLQDVLNYFKQGVTSLQRKKILAYQKTIAHTKGDKEYLKDVVLVDYRIAEDRIRRNNRHNLIEPLTREEFSKATAKLKTIIVNKELVKINTDEKELVEIENIARRYELDNHSIVNVSDFFDFLNKFYIDFVRDDANGFLVVRPTNTNQNTNETIELTFDLVYTHEIISLENGLFYKKGSYYYLITKNTYERYYENLTKKGSKTLIKDISYNYSHNLSETPFIVNGGIIINDTENETYYESFFSHSISYANMVIKTLYDSEYLRQLHAHPITIITEIPCPNQNCNNSTGIDRITQTNCKSCGGKGKILNLNMGATIVRKANDSVTDDTDNKPIVEYISPPLEGAELQIRALEKWQSKLKESLSLNTIDESQSGVAKEIDERTNQISVNSIAKSIYGNLEYILNIVTKLLNYDKIKIDKEYPKVTISYPSSFYFQDEQTLLANIENFKKSGVSGTSILIAEKNYTDFKYATNEIAKKISDIALWYDVTAHLTDEILLLFTPLNIYTKKDLLVRLKLPNVLINISKELGFIDLSNEQIKEKLDTIFNDLLSSQANTENNLPPQTTTNNG